MKEPAALVPMILFGFNRNRIRILVNPETNVIASQIDEASDVRSRRSAPEKSSFELYSRTLFQQLRLCGHWIYFQIVRLNGALIPQEGVVLFVIRIFVLIVHSQKNPQEREE